LSNFFFLRFLLLNFITWHVIFKWKLKKNYLNHITEEMELAIWRHNEKKKKTRNSSFLCKSIVRYVPSMTVKCAIILKGIFFASHNESKYFLVFNFLLTWIAWVPLKWLDLVILRVYEKNGSDWFFFLASLTVHAGWWIKKQNNKL
jgi:hypothetical protein